VRNSVVADTLAICQRTVQRCTAELEALGYLVKILRPVSGQRNASNLYYFAQPSGPIPAHHPRQRRRYRIRRLHRATPTSGRTFSPQNPPAPSGARRGWHRCCAARGAHVRP
jgi:DNA-binding transcriptional MocR family regulator